MLYDLASMTVQDVRKRLEECRTLLLPAGCTEQHGYHLPLSTDTITASGVARACAERTGAFLAPALPYTYSGGELPGTVNVAPHVVALYVREICRSFADMGMSRILIVTGHGGTEYLRDLSEGLKQFLKSEKHYRELELSVVRLSAVSATWGRYVKDGDFHAAIVETSVMMHLEPGLVRGDKPTDPPDILEMMLKDPDSYQVSSTRSDSPHELPHVDQHPGIEVGVMGYPDQASPELGALVFEEAVEGLTFVVENSGTAAH